MPKCARQGKLDANGGMKESQFTSICKRIEFVFVAGAQGLLLLLLFSKDWPPAKKFVDENLLCFSFAFFGLKKMLCFKF